MVLKFSQIHLIKTHNVLYFRHLLLKRYYSDKSNRLIHDFLNAFANLRQDDKLVNLENEKRNLNQQLESSITRIKDNYQKSLRFSLYKTTSKDIAYINQIQEIINLLLNENDIKGIWNLWQYLENGRWSQKFKHISTFEQASLSLTDKTEISQKIATGLIKHDMVYQANFIIWKTFYGLEIERDQNYSLAFLTKISSTQHSPKLLLLSRLMRKNASQNQLKLALTYYRILRDKNPSRLITDQRILMNCFSFFARLPNPDFHEMNQWWTRNYNYFAFEPSLHLLFLAVLAEFRQFEILEKSIKSILNDKINLVHSPKTIPKVLESSIKHLSAVIRNLIDSDQFDLATSLIVYILHSPNYYSHFIPSEIWDYYFNSCASNSKHHYGIYALVQLKICSSDSYSPSSSLLKQLKDSLLSPFNISSPHQLNQVVDLNSILNLSQIYQISRRDTIQIIEKYILN